MIAAQYNLLINQGANFSFLVTVKDGNGDPVDLTGYTFAGQIRAYPGASTVLATFTITLPVVADKNQYQPALTAIQTAALPAPTTSDDPQAMPTYWYDIEGTSPGGVVTRFLQGAVTVSPEVTRS